MNDNNIIQKKSFDFAIRSIIAYKYVIETKKEYVLSKQFLRSSNSIGANIPISTIATFNLNLAP